MKVKKLQKQGGTPGPKGEKGEPGSDAFGKLYYRVGGTGFGGPGSSHDTLVSCPGTTRPIGGSAVAFDDTPAPRFDVLVTEGVSIENQTPKGWAGHVENTTSGDLALQVFAICAEAATVDLTSASAQPLLGFGDSGD